MSSEIKGKGYCSARAVLKKERKRRNRLWEARSGDVMRFKLMEIAHDRIQDLLQRQLGKEKEKERRQQTVKTLPAWIRKGCSFVFCTNQWIQKHTTSHLEIINQWSFSVGGRWLGGRSLHTTRCIAQIFVEVVINVSSHLYGFCCKSDCIRLHFFMTAVHVDQHATPRLWSGFLV